MVFLLPRLAELPKVGREKASNLSLLACFQVSEPTKAFCHSFLLSFVPGKYKHLSYPLATKIPLAAESISGWPLCSDPGSFSLRGETPYVSQIGYRFIHEVIKYCSMLETHHHIIIITNRCWRKILPLQNFR